LKVIIPVLSQYFPPGHALQSDTVFPFVWSLYLPALHLVSVVVDPEQDAPAGQSIRVDIPELGHLYPAGQGRQAFYATKGLYLPGGQGVWLAEPATA